MTAFDKFINENTSRDAIKDKENRIAAFKKAVEELYALIDDEWLKPYIETDKIQVHTKSISIEEDGLGSYEAASKIFRIGINRVVLLPIGSRILGASGRVDMKCNGSSVMFLFVDKNVTSALQLTIPKKKTITLAGKLVWKYVDPNSPISYRDLDSNSFQMLLMEVING